MSSTADAVRAVVAALESDMDAIHSADFAPLRDWLSSVFGVNFKKRAGAAASSASTRAADPSAINPDEDPDPDRLSAHPNDDSLYVAVRATADSENEAELEKAGELKSSATELAGSGDIEGAIAAMTKALEIKPSAMNFAQRALLYLKLKCLKSAIKDADRALALNPESARAARVRGTARRHLGMWEKAADDLNHAQTCDYDPDAKALAAFVTERAMKLKTARWHKEQEEAARAELAAAKARAAAEHRRKQQEEEEAEAAAARAAGAGMGGGFPGGFPGGMPGGFPGGMPGVPGGAGGAGGMPAGMEALMSDPDIVAAMADPAVAAKLQAIMANPASAMQYMNDPAIGPLMMKIMSKFMGGGGGGMPGGMGGMPGMGGFPGGMGGGFPGMGGRGGGAGGRGAGAAPTSGTSAPKPKKSGNDDLD
jgi:suppressor of tumorigenicity protein 13